MDVILNFPKMYFNKICRKCSLKPAKLVLDLLKILTGKYLSVNTLKNDKAARQV